MNPPSVEYRLKSHRSQISTMQKLLLNLAFMPLIAVLPAQANSEQQCLSTIANAQQKLQGSLNVDIITKIDDLCKYRDRPSRVSIPVPDLNGGKIAEFKRLVQSIRPQCIDKLCPGDGIR